MDFLLGIGLLTLAWGIRNGWPSWSATTPVVSNTPASTGGTPAAVIPTTTSGGSTLVSNPIALGGDPPVNMLAAANDFANYYDSLPIGDPGGAHAPSSPYYPGVVSASPQAAATTPITQGPSTPITGGTVDPSTLDWLNQNYGGGPTWGDVQDVLDADQYGTIISPEMSTQ